MPPQLPLRRIPMGNVRMELQNHLATLTDSRFVAQLEPQAPAPIRTKYQDWYGLPEVLLTQIIQRAILGLEGYLPGAVRLGLALAGRPTDGEYLVDPFSLGGRGTADNFYNRLPAQLSTSLALVEAQPDLWERTRHFYREVRNPLFHGHQLSRSDLDATRTALHHVCELYDWVDEWMPLDQVLPGGSQLSHRRVWDRPQDV